MHDQGPIKRSNLLDKICFLTFRAGLVERHEDLRSALSEYLRFSGKDHISDQAIRYWFEKNSTPRRAKAFQFLLDFVNQLEDYESKTDDQKKVQAQVRTFLNAAIAGAEPPRDITNESDFGKVYLTNAGRMVVAIDGAADQAAEVAPKLVGIYLTYRLRLSEAAGEPIAQEVLRIFRRRRELRFEHWYRREAAQLQKFDGVVTVVGDMIWLVGATNVLPERLRVMNFRNIESANRLYDTYRWGMMLSDTSRPSSHEPASCRIVLAKFHERVRDLPNFVETHVRLAPVKEIQADLAPHIMRLIDNHATAISKRQSSEPETSGSGEPIQDGILKVDQETLERVLGQLA